jgi:MFS family permease
MSCPRRRNPASAASRGCPDADWSARMPSARRAKRNRDAPKVVLIFALIETGGLALIGPAPWAWLGFVGAAATGLGYSLVFPGLAVEAVRRAPSESRGLAIGVFTAFLDLALGFIASKVGLGSVFVIGAALSACAVRSPPSSRTARIQRENHDGRGNRREGGQLGDAATRSP